MQRRARRLRATCAQRRSLVGSEAKCVQYRVGRERLARRPDDFARPLTPGLFAVQPLRRRRAGADVVGVGRALVAGEAPIELTEDEGDLADVVVELLVEDAFVLDAVAERLRRAGDRRRPAPAVLGVDQEREADAAVIEQVLAPEGLLVVLA